MKSGSLLVYRIGGFAVSVRTPSYRLHKPTGQAVVTLNGRDIYLVHPTVYHGLKAVFGLRQRRSEARESKPVKPAPDDHVEAIESHVARQVWAMVKLQQLTGMRPGEVIAMRTSDLDTSAGVWSYTPGSHKTEHHGRDRIVFLGPKSQEILRP
jgi:integrase